ncbi:nuclease domain-containing protein [Achromobacter ruhlandii]|uniref:nuclease domain-containing protein n=1 Tax=Achromobacter ruhlandii TaxID=72557 RepID=UPI0007BF4010|nr:nuclease domain-containing protein [Achromobacter ruhlandii]
MMRRTPLQRKTPMKRGAPIRQRSALKASGKRMPARRSTPRATKTMYRNRALLNLAKGKPCLLRIPDVCIGGTQTTVACHSNQARHGKAGWLKAHDWATAWGCVACHAFTDQNTTGASYDEKVALWEAGFERTRLALIVSGQWPLEAEIGYLQVYGVAA